MLILRICLLVIRHEVFWGPDKPTYKLVREPSNPKSRAGRLVSAVLSQDLAVSVSGCSENNSPSVSGLFYRAPDFCKGSKGSLLRGLFYGRFVGINK